METAHRVYGRAHDGKKDWFSNMGLFTPFRSSSKEDVLSLPSLPSTPSPDVRHENGLERDGQHGKIEGNLDDIVDRRNWTSVHPSGKRPPARFSHAATVIGRKMIVVGGDSEHGKLNDVQVLHLGKLTWSELGTSSTEANSTQLLPPCRGHSLISWGKTVLLVGGEMNVPTDKVTVWSFDLETERWTKIQAKGEIPAARSGQSVTRAGYILIMFGGEDFKGRKLNDIHVLDLKSLMWLPLHTSGKGPSPRARHVAAMYDGRLLIVFGGISKSKVLNDVYALDFESSEWNRLKPKGFAPSPRAGCSGVLVGNKWYIVGGEHRGTRIPETITLDIERMMWSIVATSSPDCVVGSQGLSLVMVQRKERTFIVAFGGFGEKLKNEVQVLYIPSEQGALRSPQKQCTAATAETCFVNPTVGLIPCAGVNVASTVRSTSMEPRALVRSPLTLADQIPGLVPLRKIHSHTPSPEKLKRQECLDASDIVETSCMERRRGHRTADIDEEMSWSSRSPPEEAEAADADVEADVEGVSKLKLVDGVEEDEDGWTDEMKKLRDKYETKLGVVLEKNAIAEAKISSALREKEEAEEKLAVAARCQQMIESRLSASLKELESLKQRLMKSEAAQEESNNLSNIVHSENLRLEHDIAFLKVVLEDTQKELQTTRGVLGSERSRAFQLQVELFELKQKVHDS